MTMMLLSLCSIKMQHSLPSENKTLILVGLHMLHGEGNGTPLQYSCLENPMDGGAWKAAVHGVAEGRTRLSDFPFTFHFHALEKEMATHSSVLAWRIAGTGEPGGLPSMWSHRVGHDWSDLAAALHYVAEVLISVLQTHQAHPTLRPLHFCYLCLISLAQTFVQLTPTYLSGLRSNVASSEMPSLTPKL